MMKKAYVKEEAYNKILFFLKGIKYLFRRRKEAQSIYGSSLLDGKDRNSIERAPIFLW